MHNKQLQVEIFKKEKFKRNVEYQISNMKWIKSFK
jgi:hypothetical protein